MHYKVRFVLMDEKLTQKRIKKEEWSQPEEANTIQRDDYSNFS